MPGGHEEVKTGSGWGGTGRMRMGQGVAREDSSERHSGGMKYVEISSSRALHSHRNEPEKFKND